MPRHKELRDICLARGVHTLRNPDRLKRWLKQASSNPKGLLVVPPSVELVVEKFTTVADRGILQ